MRKYQRLLLIIVSVVSISLFLTYRHHYNRLHHVLEVFNFFGTPCNLSEFEHTEKDLLEHDWGPKPLWQEVERNEYVYSAFLEQANKVHGIGLRPSNTEVLKPCYFNFEDESKPLKGRLKTQKIEEILSSGLVSYKYTCTSLNNGKTPYSITFRSQGKSKNINLLITDNISTHMSFKITVCVMPSTFSRKSLLEFLSFHSLLGVDSFIFYFELDIPHKLVKFLRNVSKNLNMSITFLPYNVPFTLPENLTSNIIEYDCRFRTNNHSRYSVVLGMNEYLVPSNVGSKSLRLPIKRFCLNNIDVKHPMILQNFQLIDNYNFNEIKEVNEQYISNTNSSERVPNIFDSYCTVHRYEKCDKNVKIKTDFSVKKFSTDFVRTMLVQMLIHEDIPQNLH